MDGKGANILTSREAGGVGLEQPKRHVQAAEGKRQGGEARRGPELRHRGCGEKGSLGLRLDRCA